MGTSQTKPRAPRNRTTRLSAADRARFAANLITVSKRVSLAQVLGKTIHQDVDQAVCALPDNCVDLLILDPPYNLNKTFNGRRFSKQPLDVYARRLDAWLQPMLRLLTPNASVYICGDWQSSSAIHQVALGYFYVRNRITWEREKGRGAQTNWKNCAEDIWFCTRSNQYTFNVDAVKLQRRVRAPYTDDRKQPKDWQATAAGKFRITYPSNLWTDISVPFWSMPENTDHPTQKPEKLLAKLILASSNPGDVVFDPFLGSGTTSVVAKKLQRRYFGVEIDHDYCCLAEKRLHAATADAAIQGYAEQLFWERNSRVASC